MATAQAFQSALEHQQAGHLAEAEHIHRRILSEEPAHPDSLFLLSLICAQTHRLGEAITLLRMATNARPDRPDLWLHLGKSLRAQGALVEAIRALQTAVAISPGSVEAQLNLGSALQETGQLTEAISCLDRAVALAPGNAQAHYILGNALQRCGQFDRAIKSYQSALALKGNYAEALGNEGSAWKEIGQLDEAISCYRRALQLRPDALITHDNLLLALLYHPASTRESLFHECQLWNLQHAAPLASLIQPHQNKKDPGRRLRIGYISPDIANHPVGRFILPLLANHNREEFEIVCYSQIRIPDSMTSQIQRHTSQWRNIFGLTDEQVAAQIRNDQIDILVDLAMHTSKNRQLVFARKPAPVQVAYLGYAGASAVDKIDYRFTDPYLDPDKGDDRFYPQKSFRLAGTYWCYQQTLADVQVNELPALSDSAITFGSLNNLTKITDLALDAWMQILQQIPTARLLMHAPAGQARDRIVRLMQQQGLSSDRIEMLARTSPSEYLRFYHRIDIALDPFPFCGGATTCDALWMGVPVVTLAGQTPVGRAGVSILTNAGLPNLIANTTERYIQMAVDLASDLSKLADLRATMRDRIQRSRLMDGRRFAADIESAYRWMWKQWSAAGVCGTFP
jgi:protein O-GlcNAc transferase